MALVGAPAFTVVTPTVVTPLEQIPRAQGTTGTGHGVSGTGADEGVEMATLLAEWIT
jgi:hypothetical protein